MGGRKSVLICDDGKDHFGGRTADLSYVVATERSIGLDAWADSMSKIVGSYAKAHNLRLRSFTDVTPASRRRSLRSRLGYGISLLPSRARSKRS